LNPYVRDRIQRKLETLSDERLYQILDYVEFLETKYAERAASPVGMFQRLAESLEDKMRVGGVAVGTITETMGMFNKAAGMLNGVAQSAISVTNDVVNAASRAVDQVGASSAPPSAAGAVAAPRSAQPPASQNSTNNATIAPVKPEAAA
jgi:hypothetical protein